MSILQTPLPVIAKVSLVVTRAVDQITGDRVDYPLMVAAACVEALKPFGIESRMMYGQAAWIEVLEDHSVIWAGCWGENISFWAATRFGEVVDLNTSVAHRKRAHDMPGLKARYSPPMLWSAEIPVFYRYIAEGVAELEITDDVDTRRYEQVLKKIKEECVPERLQSEDPEFPNEPILCPSRKILDDSNQTFRQFDRAVSIRGIPESPI